MVSGIFLSITIEIQIISICKMSVGERIRYYRVLKGMSQEALALEANINAAFVGHLERGLKSPTVTTLEKMTGALEMHGFRTMVTGIT